MAISKEKFTDLVLQYQPKLQTFIERKVANPHEADDIVQESIIDAYKDFDNLQDESKFFPWLKTIANNTLIDQARKARRRVWTDIVDQLESGNEVQQKELFSTFDAMFRRLGNLKEKDKNIIAAALHYCLNFSAREIAVITASKANTVSRTIKQFESHLSDSQELPPMSREKDISLKWKLANYLVNIGLHPMEGKGYRNSYFLREGYSLAKLTARQYPDSPEAIFSLFRVTALYSYASQYPNDMTVSNNNKKTRRDLMDRKLIADAVELYQKLQDMPLLDELRFDADYNYYLLIPARNEDVDWKKLLSICEQGIACRVSLGMYFKAANCLNMLQGPLVAARYLERHKNGMQLRNTPFIFHALGSYFFEAGHWKKAKRYLKAAAKTPISAELEKSFEERLKICSDHLKKATKKPN